MYEFKITCWILSGERPLISVNITFPIFILVLYIFLFFSCVSPQNAVGLFGSEVKTHLLLFVNRGTKHFTELKERLGALAPEFTGKVRMYIS